MIYFAWMVFRKKLYRDFILFFVQYLMKVGDYMRIGFIGAGKVGFTLGRYFSERNMYVSGYFSRNPESAKEAARFTASSYYEDIKDLVANSDIIFITVPDGVIGTIWEQLKSLSEIGNKIICHCSGALSSAVFSESNQVGAFGYSIHPMYAVNDKLTSYQEISKAFFTIEGDEKYLGYFKELFESWGHDVQVIDAECKVKYHSAAVFASNYVVALMGVAQKLLVECGFDEKLAKRALSPIAINNVGNIAKVGVVDALTGPVERCDTETIKKHLGELDDDMKLTYTVLAKQLIGIAEEKNPERDYSELIKLLDAQLSD